MVKASPGPRSKIARYGAEEVVNPILLGGGTLAEARDAFHEFTGEPIGLASMSRHNQRLFAAADKMKSLEVMVDRLLEHEGYYEGSDPGEKAAALARRMMLTLAVEAVADIPPETMKKMPPDKLAQMITRLEKSRISGERLRLQYNAAFEKAKEAILTKLEEEMRGRPELREQVADLAEAAYRDAIDEAEGRG